MLVSRKIIRACRRSVLTVIWFILATLALRGLYHDVLSAQEQDIDEIQFHPYSKSESNLDNDVLRKKTKVQNDFSGKIETNVFLSKEGASLEHVTAIRDLDRLIHENWFYFRSELNILKKYQQKKDNELRINSVLENGANYHRMLQHLMYKLAAANKQDELHNYQSTYVGDIVQRRLTILQNPKDCSNARKLICSLQNECGFGCQLHHVTYCLIQAYATNRTLILESKGWEYASQEGWDAIFQPLSKTCVNIEGKSVEKWSVTPNEHIQVMVLPRYPYTIHTPDYMPLAIPEDLADRILRFHGDPPAWWIGQFVKYLTRPNEKLEEYLSTEKDKLEFQNPIVGIHIRRTDKVDREAVSHGIDEYMQSVEEWFSAYEMRQPLDKRRVYLATDDALLLIQAQQMYPNYIFINDNNMTKKAGVKSRYTKSSLIGVYQDVHFLSLCDFIVVTFSSNIGRAAYELMQPRHEDASKSFKSLDDIFYFNGQKDHLVYAIEDHVAQLNVGSVEIDIKKDDAIVIFGNHWNGYSKGRNLRTGKTGLFPTFKTIDRLVRIKMRTYE